MNYPPNTTNQQYPNQYQQAYLSNQPPMVPSSPMPKKPRRMKNIGWIIAVIIAFFIGMAAGHTGSSTGASTTTANASNTTNTQPAQTHSTPVPTPTPTPPPTWQTTHTYSGNGAKKTETITVPNDWKLQWTCDPTSFYGNQYNVAVTVTSPDNTPVDLAVNTLCSDANKSGETEEHRAGQVFLDINSEAAWTITIQELK